MIEIKNFEGKLLLTYNKENLRGANLRGANLRGANLRGANLIDANLIDANLRGANLIDANLRGANLEGANLRGANLRGANLIDANLRGANLRGANLIDANLEGADLPMYCKWRISFFNDLVDIGCKSNTIEGWDAFFSSDKEFDTKRNTPEFKQIQACYEGFKAYKNHLLN